MTKSIVTGGVMLVALAALVMGLTDVLALSSAGIVSWAAVGAVATILFGAFGGFKPFFSSGMPDDDEGGGGGNGGGGNGGGEDDGGGGSPLEALTGQSQSIARKLVTVGAEDENGRPLFNDRAPIVSQPKVDSPPIFNPDSQMRPSSAQPNNPLFGQALREQLENHRVPGDGTADTNPEDADHDLEALETGLIETAPEPVTSPPFVGEAAPWVAARNAQIDQDASSVPMIDVEESPSWVSTADTEEFDADVLRSDPDADQDEELAETETAAADYTIAEPAAEADHSADHGSGTEDAPELDESDPQLSDATVASTSVDDAGSDTATIEEITEDRSAEEIVVGEEVSPESDPHDINESSDEGLALATSQSDQLPVVMKSPTALEIQKYSPTEILAVVRAQESELVDTLIGEGVLTTSGPITDKDVRTMLFVAVSSNELIDVLTEASGDSPKLRAGSRAALPKG